MFLKDILVTILGLFLSFLVFIVLFALPFVLILFGAIWFFEFFNKHPLIVIIVIVVIVVAVLLFLSD